MTEIAAPRLQTIAPMLLNKLTCAKPSIFQVGDTVVTCLPVTMRREEMIDSELIGQFAHGNPCEILEIGEGRRVKVCIKTEACGSAIGWISCRTVHDTPLIVKADLFNIGDASETCSPLSLTEEENIESAVMEEVVPVGTRLEMIEIGEDRRVKIRTKETVGWIDCRTGYQEPLIIKVAAGAAVIEGFDTDAASTAVESQASDAREDSKESSVVEASTPPSLGTGEDDSGASTAASSTEIPKRGSGATQGKRAKTRKQPKIILKFGIGSKPKSPQSAADAAVTGQATTTTKVPRDSAGTTARPKTIKGVRGKSNLV
jgi:hypothetical protein